MSKIMVLLLIISLNKMQEYDTTNIIRIKELSPPINVSCEFHYLSKLRNNGLYEYYLMQEQIAKEINNLTEFLN